MATKIVRSALSSDLSQFSSGMRRSSGIAGKDEEEIPQERQVAPVPAEDHEQDEAGKHEVVGQFLQIRG
jgi:hypothetical protein